MYNKKVWLVIGFIISSYTISSVCMEISLSDTKNIVESSEDEPENTFPIQFEPDPTNSVVDRINLSLYLYYKGKQNHPNLSVEQTLFLEKYKNKPLPWWFSEDDKALFDTLLTPQEQSFFTCTKQIKKRAKTKPWTIDRGKSLPGKFKK